MKKNKLLTSLSTIGFLLPIVPTLTTSCSTSTSWFTSVYWFDGTKIQDWVMEIGDEQEFTFKDFCAWHDGNIFDIVTLDVTSSNSNVIDFETKQAHKSYNAIAKDVGTTTLTFNIADANGHTESISVVDTVVNKGSKKSIELTDVVETEDFIWDSETSTITFTNNHIVRAKLGTIKCSIPVTYNIDLFSKLCGIEINNNNELTMRVEESYDVGLKRICIYPNGGIVNQLSINIVYAIE